MLKKLNILSLMVQKNLSDAKIADGERKKMDIRDYKGCYIDVDTLLKKCNKKGVIEPKDFTRIPMLRVIRCEECKYSKQIGCKDEDTGEDLLGCTHLVNGMDEEGWVMTVNPYSYCSWGRLSDG